MPGATVAYFSMEIGLTPSMPTYSGGLGVLAADTIRSAADLELSMVAVTLLYRQGYFVQRLDAAGNQYEDEVRWSPEDHLSEQGPRAVVELEGRNVVIRAWKHNVTGVKGFQVPVFFLDTDLPENSDVDRALTGRLYWGDDRYRLCQEVVLGIGGVRILRAMGYDRIGRFHMNEGHSALLTLELLAEERARGGGRPMSSTDIAAVREKCVFTTHTPVAAGHDKFSQQLVVDVLGPREELEFTEHFCCDDVVNTTFMALNLSGYVNGVARRHAAVSNLMFAPYHLEAIANGVHAATWTSAAFAELFDRYIPGWQEDNWSLRYALNIPGEDVWSAHRLNKLKMIEAVNRMGNARFDVETLTIGFARRSTEYKRADLVLRDLNRLRSIRKHAGPLQIVFAGKAHPRDDRGRELIRRICEVRDVLRADDVLVAYLPNYDLELGHILVAGCDLWLNTPAPPHEASGTSGMKAALNGVPSLSVLDGWWIEGHVEGVTGWSIGPDHHIMHVGEATRNEADDEEDARFLYEKLEHIIMPMFYSMRPRFIDVMRQAIAINGSFFNTERMVVQYMLKAYRNGA